MSAWKPIETAPKDSAVLLTDSCGIIALGCWCAGQWFFGEGDATSISDEDMGEVAILNYWGKEYGPTHWMPLPRFPQ